MNNSISFDLEFKRNPYRGMYIALEGIDGSGKTSQIKKLRDYFTSSGKSVVTVQFPRKTQGILASINKSNINGTSSIPKPAFQYLFTADYVMLLEEMILPALQHGDVVLSDRFHCFSSVAYGMWETGRNDRDSAYSLMIANGLFSKHHQFFIPDITFYLSIDVETAEKRMSEKKEKDLYEKKDILEKIIKGYEFLTREFPDVMTIIDGKKSVEEITEEMVQEIEKGRLKGGGR
jgi:dTMP kinase